MSPRLLGALALCVSLGARAQDDVLIERPADSTDAGYGFLQYLPPDYSLVPGRHAALVVFLHGAGETTSGGTLWNTMVKHGPGKLLTTGATIDTTDGGLHEARGGSRIFADENAVVVMPQSSGSWNMQRLSGFLTWLQHEYRIDPRRVYVTGISMGGAGTWNYVSLEARRRVAAALPICGAVGAGDAAPFIDTPVWALHAWGDPTVSRSNSINWVNAIAAVHEGAAVPTVLTGYPHVDGNTSLPAAGTMTARYQPGGFTWSAGVEAQGDSPVRLTLYTDNAHDSWTRTYANADVWAWLFVHRRPVHPDFDGALVVDDLDEGFSVVGPWVREPASGPDAYGWEVLRASVADSPLARFSGTVPHPGVYRLAASNVGGSDRTVATVSVTSDVGPSTLPWDQRPGGVARLGEVPVAGDFTVEVVSSASSGVLAADAIALRFVAPLDAGPEDAGVGDGGVSDGGFEDGGAEADGGVGDGGDVQASSDAGAGGGTGAQADSGVDEVEVVIGSCGCGSTSPGLAWVLLPFGLVLLRRRRTRAR